MLFTGYALSSSVIAGVMQGCQPEPTGPEWTPQYLSQEQADQVTAMVDVMLPATDTPGAKELGVPAFIDLMVKEWYEPKDQEKFKSGLAMMDERAQSEHGKNFVSLSAEEQLVLMNAIDEETKDKLKAEEEAMSQTGRSVDDERYWPFMHKLKNLAILGYFSSEKVGTEVLAYDPIPGDYLPCIPLEDVGKSWSLG